MSQISAVVSDQTIELLEKTVKKRGLKKAYVIEAAILHHLAALRDIPEDFIVSPMITLSSKGWRAVVEATINETDPPDALRELMKND